MGRYITIVVSSVLLCLGGGVLYDASQDSLQEGLEEVPVLQLAWLLGTLLVAMLGIARFRNAR